MLLPTNHGKRNNFPYVQLPQNSRNLQEELLRRQSQGLNFESSNLALLTANFQNLPLTEWFVHL